jgi:type III pantothenate kinase
MGSALQVRWETEHLSNHDHDQCLPLRSVIDSQVVSTWSPIGQDWIQHAQKLDTQPLSLYLASVVPEQTQCWQSYPALQVITLDHIELSGLYPTLGIDRALGVWGAGVSRGWPALSIDAGTALTLTGVDASQALVGGAILPGLRLQLQSLGHQTALLPALIPDSVDELPPRWALTTEGAIIGGVTHTLLASIQGFVNDWLQTYPQSTIVLTGGDGALLWRGLQQQAPDQAEQITYDPNLIFWGIRACYARQFESLR